jgi:hypothetical protein
LKNSLLICGSESSTEPTGSVLCRSKVLARIIIFRSVSHFPFLSNHPPILLEIYISILGEELFTDSYPCHSHKFDCGTPGDPRARNVNCVSASLYQACFETFSVDSRHRGSDLALEDRLHNADFTFADVSSYRATV